MKQKRLSGQLIKKNGSYRIAEPVDSIVKILGIILSLSWKVARYGSRGKTTNILPSRKLVGTEISLINNHIEGYGDIRARASEKEQAILTLYDNGMIRDCNPPSENCSIVRLVN